MSVPGPSEVSASRALFAQRQQQWRNQNLFVDRIYQVCNNVHPGIGLERAAVEHIQELLMRILFEILESRPQKIEDMERCMRASLPASMCHWVMQFQETNEALHNLTTKKLHDKRSANARSLTSLLHALQPKIKEHLGYKVDEKVVLYILSVIEYVTADILKWTGNYVKNIRKGNHTIGLQNLKIALSADKSLMELTEMLYNEDEASTAGILNEIGEENWKITQELTYEKVSRDFNHEEEQYLRDLNLIIHVFRRRFESAFGVDDKHYLEEIFGNILELHELTVKVQRIVEDAIEMSDTPCMGAGLWELAEAHELDVYITYMDLFKTSVSDVLSKLLIDPKYNKFFEMEDRSYSVTPGGETFRLAVKYVLPTLLQAPVVHFFRYVEYVNMLIHLSKMGGDLEDLKSAKSYFSGLVVKIEALCPTSLKCHLKNEQTARCIPEQSRSRQLKRIQEIQRSIELWEGKEIGYTCAEVIREGDLLMVRPGVLPTSEMIKKGRGATDRHLFLFDHLLVLTKIHRSSKPEKPLYKYKGKVLIRKTDIFDLSDTEELQNAFKIESRSSGRDGAVTSSWILFCKSAEEKTSWMSDLVMIQTKSLLDRMLDSSLKEEEKRIPLIIPGPDQYRFVDVDCDENIVFEDYTSSSGIPVVKHGTVLKLIERLTYPLYTDNNYVRTFLTTYRSFCTPQEMLQLLIERFNVPTPHQLKGVEQTIAPPQTRSLLNGPYATVHSRGLCGQVPPAIWSRVEQSYQRFRKEYQRPIQCRVLSVIRQWVNGHWYDFEGDDKLLENLCAFLEETDRQANVTNQHKKWCKSIQMCIERKRRSDSTAAQTPTVELEDGIPPPLNSPNSFAPAKPPIVWHTAKKGDIDSYDLLTLHPLEIGRQVTLLQFDLYRAIKPIELVGSAWTKRDKDQRSPQLLKLIDHSTMLTYWVARSIVETPSLEERVGMFSRVLEVMAVFEELNNFTGLVALYSALNSSSVYRLKACWERIDREKQMCYEKFKKLCNPHWKEMIQRLQSINPPCVPFFGHYLSKIFFYEEGNSTFVQNSDEDLSHEQVNGEGATNTNILNRKVLVSFVKCRRIAAIISDIQMYQNQPYSLQVEPSIRKLCNANLEALAICSFEVMDCICLSVGCESYVVKVLVVKAVFHDVRHKDDRYGTNWVTLYLKTLGKANAKEEWSLLGEKELLYGVFEDADQFFETINPLNGFEGKESLETYMWEQSLKVEPKDAEKLDNVKPSRPPNVLKSPGIKPPKTLSSVVSSSGPSNHYAGYRSSGRGFSTAFNTYSPGMFNEPPDTPRCFAENASQMEEKNSHLGMVEINPGYQPRYLGDARRGEVSPLTPLPNLATPPPLIPRLRKEKARSGPPSPLSNIISSCSKSNEPSHSPPPPLYPRRTSPHFFPSPIPPPPPFRAPSVTSCTAPTSPLSPPSSSAPTERAESFVFPPNSSMDENRTLLTEAGASHAGCSNAPAVPPRRKGDALPAPLPLDAVRVVWSGEASPGTPLVTAVLPLPPSFDNDAPPLYPRRLVNVEPPPRPPKKNKQRCLASASTNTAYMESSGSESPPPPLPPKTYKRQQRRS